MFGTDVRSGVMRYMIVAIDQLCRQQFKQSHSKFKDYMIDYVIAKNCFVKPMESIRFRLANKKLTQSPKV